MAETPIDTTGMSPDAAARYRVMVTECQRMAREGDAHRARAAEAEAEKAALRRELGLHPGTSPAKPGTMA